MDDDTGTNFLERLSVMRGKIVDGERTHDTDKERDLYMRMMEKMQDKYETLERKIRKMTDRPWNTSRELTEIEKKIKASYDKSAIMKKMSSKRLSRKQISRIFS